MLAALQLSKNDRKKKKKMKLNIILWYTVSVVCQRKRYLYGLEWRGGRPRLLLEELCFVTNRVFLSGKKSKKKKSHNANIILYNLNYRRATALSCPYTLIAMKLCYRYRVWTEKKKKCARTHERRKIYNIRQYGWVSDVRRNAFRVTGNKYTHMCMYAYLKYIYREK